MNLAVYEWRKLFRLPALWAFLALCLAFNGLLIATLSPYDRAFFNETSQTAKALGQRLMKTFLPGWTLYPPQRTGICCVNLSPGWRTFSRRMTPGNSRISMPVWWRNPLWQLPG